MKLTGEVYITKIDAKTNKIIYRKNSLTYSSRNFFVDVIMQAYQPQNPSQDLQYSITHMSLITDNITPPTDMRTSQGDKENSFNNTFLYRGTTDKLFIPLTNDIYTCPTGSDILVNISRVYSPIDGANAPDSFAVIQFNVNIPENTIEPGNLKQIVIWQGDPTNTSSRTVSVATFDPALEIEDGYRYIINYIYKFR